MNDQNKIIAKMGDRGKRLDLFLSALYPDHSRGYFQKLIKQGSVFVNNKVAKTSYKIIPGDNIDLSMAPITTMKELKPENIPLDIIYENQNVIVVNKQSGLVVHPAKGHQIGTLINALIKHSPEILNFESKNRPGLVHRLDRETSGVMIIAKNERSLRSLALQIKARTIVKIYLGLCLDWPKEEGKLVNYLGRHPRDRKKFTDVGPAKGREAVLVYKVLDYFSLGNDKVSLVQFNLITGRTHQIRIQMCLLGHPIIGDKTYFNKKSIGLSRTMGVKRQMLHARDLTICLPNETEPKLFSAPLPDDFKMIISKLKRV